MKPHRSHQYETTAQQWGVHWLGPVVVATLLGAMMHLAARNSALPAPRPTLDVDRGVMVHQIEASRSPHNTKVILIGDSSCLMNVDANVMKQRTGNSTLNLGTLSFLNLECFSQLLRQSLESAATPPNVIVLLVHPEFVRRKSPSTHHVGAFKAVQNGFDYYYGTSPRTDPRWWLGAHIVENRLLARLPIPLTGAFREYYGFSTELLSFMTQHKGSAVDPRELNATDLRGSSDYRVAERHQREAKFFNQIIPPSTQLFIGLSPIPSSFPEAPFQGHYDRLLEEWTTLFPKGIPLKQLPATLDDSEFATKTHLRPSAVPPYTDTLGRLLSVE